MSNKNYQEALSHPSPIRNVALQVLPYLPDDVPLLYALLNSGTPPWKMSKLEAQYTQPSPFPNQCKNCVHSYQHVKSKNFICDQMRGNINPKGWCRLWKGE